MIINSYSFGASAPVYILDTYPADVAHSFQQLKTGVTNVVRVRRSSDSAESDFTPTEITDGTLTTWTGANNGFITTIYDQEGSNDFTQVTASTQPKLVSSGTLLVDAGGNAYCDFDGSNDQMRTGTGVFANTEIDVWFFGVTTSDDFYFNKDADTTAGWRIQFNSTFNNNSAVYLSAAWQNASGSPQVTGQKQITSNYDRTNEMETYVDGSLEGSDTVLADVNMGGSNGKLLIGEKSNGTNGAMQFQESILYFSDETSNRTSIEGDQDTRYGL